MSPNRSACCSPPTPPSYAGVRKDTQLAEALTNRDLIGQAKGILMERYKISADHAFLALALTSQHTNRKLHDIADELCRTGAIPTATSHPGESRGEH